MADVVSAVFVTGSPQHPAVWAMVVLAIASPQQSRVACALAVTGACVTGSPQQPALAG
jgi:hypothetical protein